MASAAQPSRNRLDSAHLLTKGIARWYSKAQTHHFRRGNWLSSQMRTVGRGKASPTEIQARFPDGIPAELIMPVTENCRTLKMEYGFEES